MPIDYATYPKDWKLRSRFVRFYRARGRCEWCGAANGQPHPVTGSLVVLTRASNEGFMIRRRRRCKNKKCGERFTTIETIVPEGAHLPTMLREQQRAIKLFNVIKKIMDSRRPI